MDITGGAARRRGLPSIAIPPPSENGSGLNTPTSSIFSNESRMGRRSRRTVQDRFYSKILEKVVDPGESEEEEEEVELYAAEEVKEKVKHAAKGFSLPSVDLNLVRLNARIGALFEQQEYVAGIFTWDRPVHTLSFLAIHTLIWLHPHVLPGIPLLASCYLVMMPAFLHRHPRPTNDPRTMPINFGPPTEAPAVPRAVAPLIRDFRQNMRDLQHTLEHMNETNEKIAKYVVPQFNFSDESVTTEIFIVTLFSAIFVFLTAHLIDWPNLFLVGGWVGILARHPAVKEILKDPASSPASSQKRLQDLLAKVQSFIHEDVILDDTPQTRQVEVFEIQKHQPATQTWEPWLFSPTAYDPLSPARIAGSRPRGTQFFDDVAAPAGWKWKQKKWDLDRASTEWVQQRMVTGVEVETSGDSWVYDIPDEDEEAHMSAMAASTTLQQDKVKDVAKSGWEEASGVEKRGEWRRRRWTRDVERKGMRQ